MQGSNLYLAERIVQRQGRKQRVVWTAEQKACRHLTQGLLHIADVRTAVVKGGGKMADSGSVLFNFQRRGEVYVKGNANTEEEVTV